MKTKPVNGSFFYPKQNISTPEQAQKKQESRRAKIQRKLKHNQYLTGTFNKSYRENGKIGYKIDDALNNDDVVFSHCYCLSNPKNEA